MKLPLSWLNEYVDVSDIPPADLAERLTRSGLQVEAIETSGPEPLSDFFVVAEVLTCEVIEGTHLHKTTVTDGKETLQIVCGAPNCRAGLKTALAKIGAVVPDGGFKIKKGKLRGVESFGMLCSSKELALPGGDHAGIMELPPETPVGAFMRDVVGGEKPETVFDIEVTWNRPDALSVIGLAREFATVLGRPLKMPAVDFTESNTDVNEKSKRTNAARLETASHEIGRGTVLNARHHACGVTRAAYGVQHLHLHLAVHIYIALVKVDGGHLHGAAENCAELAREANDAQGVRTVPRHFDVEHRLGLLAAHHVARERARGRICRQLHDAVVVAAGKRQLLRTAKHSERLHSAQLPLLDLEAAVRHHRADLGEHALHAGTAVGRAAHHLHSLLAVRDGGLVQMRAFDHLACEHLAHNEEI